MIDDARPRLGRGLAALMGENTIADASGPATAQKTTPIEFLRPNPRNPRQQFSEESLQELADSIRERGIVQPILVRQLSGVTNVYEIIAGERRWRAAQRVGLHDVPIVVIEADDRQSLEFAIIENVQRADLNAIEEAKGYDRLIEEFAYSQADLAKIIGKSRSHVANTLRLLKLPEHAQSYVIDGQISAGHARALLSVADPVAIAKKIIDDGLTVRDVERLVAEKGQENKTRSSKVEQDTDIKQLQKELGDALGMQVVINSHGEAGAINIKFKTLEQFDMLKKKLTN
jgi:ParB family chromosome partitioning protein